MEKTQWKTLKLSLAVGEEQTAKDIMLEKGKRIVSAVAKTGKPQS